MVETAQQILGQIWFFYISSHKLQIFLTNEALLCAKYLQPQKYMTHYFDYDFLRQ